MSNAIQPIDGNSTDHCLHTKRASMAIGLVLSIIVALGAVLVVLVQKGYFNHFADLIETKWLYLTIGLAGTIFLISLSCSIAHGYSQSKQTHVEVEATQAHQITQLASQSTRTQNAPSIKELMAGENVLENLKRNNKLPNDSVMHGLNWVPEENLKQMSFLEESIKLMQKICYRISLKKDSKSLDEEIFSHLYCHEDGSKVWVFYQNSNDHFNANRPPPGYQWIDGNELLKNFIKQP